MSRYKGYYKKIFYLYADLVISVAGHIDTRETDPPKPPREPISSVTLEVRSTQSNSHCFYVVALPPKAFL